MKRNEVLKNGTEIEIRTLTIADMDHIRGLQQEVIDALIDSSSLQPLTDEEFTNILNGNGLMIGAFFEQQLIAFRAMLEPEMDEEHLGRDAGLVESEWPFVLYSEITNVHPNFRGNGLQVLLGQVILKEVDEQKFRYIAATVAPFNIPSLVDKFAHGLEIVALKEKYGNRLRYILIKELATRAEVIERSETVELRMADTSGQQKYLQDGWIGIGIKKISDEWYVQFVK